MGNGAQSELNAAGTFGLGLAGAASWGSGDFCGGLASRRTPALPVVMASQFAGFLLMVAAALLLGQPMAPTASLGWGLAVGGVGLVGIGSLYRGLAKGPMSIVAPLSAVLAAAIPIPFSVASDGWPSPLLGLGLVFGLVGIWLVARGAPMGSGAETPALGLAVVAGVSFGLFYVLLDQVSATGVLWSLAAARVGSVVLLAPYVAARRPAFPKGRTAWALTLLAGALDVGGNVAFVLVAQVGRLDVAAVLLSLYPAATAILAFLVLRERLARSQMVGVAAMAAAIVAMSLA